MANCTDFSVHCLRRFTGSPGSPSSIHLTVYFYYLVMCNWFLIMTIVSRTRIFDKPPLPQWETPKSATFYVEKKDGCIRPIAKIFPLSGGRSRSMSTVVRSLSTPNVPFVADFGSYLLTLVGKNVAIMVKFRAKNQMMNNAAEAEFLLSFDSCSDG